MSDLLVKAIQPQIFSDDSGLLMPCYAGRMDPAAPSSSAEVMPALSHSSLLSAQRSIGAVLAVNSGTGPGFDFLRLALALAVVHQHAKWIATNVPQAAIEAINTVAAPAIDATIGLSQYKRPLFIALVPMFFALSGFLVTGSALRTRNTARFLALRVLRIVPALSVEVLLVAFLIGPVLTVLPLREYFTSPGLYAYFGNIIGLIRFELPGLFLNSPVPVSTNAALWTLPGEFYCYLFMAVGMASSIVYRRSIGLGLFAATTAGLVILSLTTGFGVTKTALYGTPVITYYFFVGVVFYLFRDRIPASPLLIAPVGALSYVLLMYDWSAFIAPISLTYMTVLVGCLRIPEVSRYLKGDYSYGIYLYHFPIAQMLITSLPWFRGHGWSLFFATAALATVVGFFSWHLVEKRVLRLKALIVRTDRPIIQRFEDAPNAA